ncbi:MAG: PIG-L deacetylase family protein [Bryobacteraceae bacterium]
MQPVNFKNISRILCLGAHSDDIEIGCGGTILKLTEENPELNITWVVFSAEGIRKAEAEQSARAFLRTAGMTTVTVKDFRGSFFPSQEEPIKEFFETLKDIQPDLILTHYREDLHQDHRVVSDLTWNTFRRHVVLEYEIPKFDGDFGAPNLFVPISRRHCDRKVKNLLKYFKSQAGRHWFAADLFLAVSRIRGMECDSPTRHAEAFYSRKIIWG